MGKSSITASELKSKSAEVLARVMQSRTSVVITKRGRPIAKIVPIEDTPASLFGIVRGSVTILGDIVEPIDTTWEAAQ